MIGFIYRGAVSLKEFGERRRLGALIRLGLWIKGLVIKGRAKSF
jgi:hypothetical protein